MAISDSSFPNNGDLTSQRGHIIVLTDDTGRGNILSYASYKYKRVVRSVLGGEIYSFIAIFDSVYVLHDELCRIFRCKIRVVMLSDSACFFILLPDRRKPQKEG